MNYDNYLNTAVRRLAYYRSVAAKHNENYGNGKPGQTITWKEARVWSNRPDWLAKKGPKNANFYYTPENERYAPTMLQLNNLDQWPGTVEGDAHDIAKLDHTGWNADNFQCELIIGAVVSIHTAKGRYYFPAIYYTESDKASVYMSDNFTGEDAEREAARRADWYAERLAEQEREYDAKDQAEQQIEEHRQTIRQARADIRALYKEIKNREFTPAVCGAIREKIEECLDQRREAFNRIAELESNFWAAVE